MNDPRERLLRVLYVETGSGHGGSTESLRVLLASLDRSRVEPLVAAPAPAARERLGALASETHAVEPAVIALRGDEGRLAALTRGVLPARRSLLRIIQTRAVDLLHTQNDIHDHLPSIWAARTAGIPCVCHVRNIRPLARSERWAAGWVAALVAPSEAVAAQLGSEGIAKDKLAVIPNAVDPAVWAGIAPRRGDEAVVVVLGTLRPEKGIDLALEAAPAMKAAVPELRLRLAGKAWSPEYLARVQARAAELGPWVEIPGRQEDPRRCLEDADLVLVPTLLAEGFGRSVLEAMAAGRPVVASRLGAVPEVLGDTNVLVPPGDARALAEATVAILRLPDRGAALGAAGRARALERFGPAASAAATLGLYDAVLARRSRRRLAW